MAKRPTLTLGPKARGKAQAIRQLTRNAMTPNTLKAQAAPAPERALHDPFASSPKSKAVYQSTERARSSLIGDYTEFSQATASKSGRLGFWADGEDIFAELSGSTESIHSDTYIGSRVTSEQVLASRIQAAGPDVAAAFLDNAKKAIGLQGVDHTGFAKSTNPAEKLAYMAGQGQINLQSVASAISGANRDWGNPKEEGTYEADFNERYAEAAMKKQASTSLQNPTQRAMSVVGAMTVSHRRWKQQVDAPDLITPDLPTDLPTHMRSQHTEDNWSKKLLQANKAMERLAQAYIDPSKMQGDELGESYESLVSRTTSVLNKLVPLKISDTGFEMATRGPGSAPIGWHRAMPTVAQVAKMLPGSDRGFLVDKVSKMWTEQDGEITSPFTAAIQTIREAYRSGDEGGMQKAKDFSYREMAYLQDEMAASGLVDPTQTVVSRNPGRDEMYDFKVTTDIGEVIESAMQARGVTHADFTGDAQVREQVKAAAAEIAATGSALNTGVNLPGMEEMNYYKAFFSAQSAARPMQKPTKQVDVEGEHGLFYNFGSTQPDQAKTKLARKLLAENPLERDPLTPFPTGDRGKGGKATSSRRNAPAPEVAPKVGDTVTTAAAATAEMFQASGDPEAARAKYFSERPWLQAIADDDDKHDPNSKWQKGRRGRVTSSAAGELFDPAQAPSAMRKLFEGASTDPRKPVKLGGQSIWTRSGDALEPIALDWYSKHIDPNTFSPGLIYNRNRPGQATTPDAIADNGRRIVEVKSRNAFLDPDKIDMTTKQGRQDAATLMKNYIQMQHQMYLTGANSADLVEILRDVENPNLPRGKGALDESNIRTRRIDRDNELIQRMAPQWEAAGKAADQISGLKPSQQKLFAKAVEEGNIASFEKLTKKYGIDGGAALAATLGMPDEDVTGGGKGSGSGGGGGRRGGRGRRPGGDFGGNFGGFGGRDAPTELRGGTRGVLSAMGPMGRMVNVGLTAAEIAWNTAKDLNNTGLNLSMGARSVGMSEQLFRDTRMDMASGRYVDMGAAQSDISNIALAKGGMELGFVDRARQLVIGSRGAITLGDIQRSDLQDPSSVRKLMEQTEDRLRRRGVSDTGIAAVMEQTGLQSILGASGVEEGRRKLNDSVVQISDAVLSMELFAGGALGDISSHGVELVNTVKQGFTDVLGVLRGDATNIASFDPQGRKADGSTRDERFGESKLFGAEETDAAMYAEYQRKKAKAENPVGVKSDAAKAIFEYMGEAKDGWDMMSSEERNRFAGNLGTYSKQEQEKIIQTLRGSHANVGNYAPSVMSGRMEVHLMTDGVAVTTIDDTGQVTSQAFKPYVQGQRE